MRIIKNLLLVTLPVLIILIIITELLLREYLPVADPFERFKNRYDNSFIPSQMPANVHYRFTSNEGLKNMDTAMSYSTNNVGFRGDSLVMPKPEGEVRIFLIGGSTAQCLYIDDAKSINSVMQHELQAIYANRSIKVYTAAKSGDASAEHLAMLAHRIIHMQPDMVVVFAGINDLRKSVQKYDAMHLRSQKLYTPKHIYLAATDFQVGRRLYYLLKNPKEEEIRETIPMQTNYRQLFKIQAATPEHDSIPHINASPYAVNLRSIAGVCRENKVPLVFMPNQSTWNSADLQGGHWLLTCGGIRYREDHMQNGLRVFNDSMKNIAAGANIPFVDMPGAMPPTSEYFYDDCHFTTLGSVTCGRLLAGFIINNKLIDTARSVSTFKYK
jgi:lysophospholipase L1-like esterase